MLLCANYWALNNIDRGEQTGISAFTCEMMAATVLVFITGGSFLRLESVNTAVVLRCLYKMQVCYISQCREFIIKLHYVYGYRIHVFLLQNNKRFTQSGSLTG